MMNDDHFHVVVLDDRSRFPLHLWRYLSRSVGFGIGDVSLGGDELHRSGPGPLRLRTPDGRASVWWVKTVPPKAAHADDVTNVDLQLVEELEGILAQAPFPERRLFLVDVGGDRFGSTGVLWKHCFRALAQAKAAPKVELSSKQVWLLSSYGVGSRRLQKELFHEYSEAGDPPLFLIRPKNAKTLQAIFERTGRAPRVCAPLKEPAEELHVLITGAGFEVKSDSTQPVSPLGMRDTDLLLKSAFLRDVWKEICRPNEPVPKKTGGSFYYPNLLDEERDQATARGIANLDGLWSFLLEVALKTAWNDRSNAGLKSNERKAHLLSLEVGLRESFRAALVADDWGHLTQVLDAARLPWDVWWTTNYSHFVDRAVDVLDLKASDHGGPPGVGKPTAPVATVPLPWRIVSIATEARLLMRRRFFRASGKSGSKPDERFLFKLHGDLAHLSTMAIAGHDKELFTPLTLEIDSLHWVYEAAGDWTEGLIKGKKATEVYWHIVGHDLRDEVLDQTIDGVLSSCGSDCRHEILLINPKAGWLLKDLSAGKQPRCTCRGYECKANEWLAILENHYCRMGTMWKPKDGGLPAFVREHTPGVAAGRTAAGHSASS